MGYYDLSAPERKKVYEQMETDIVDDLSYGNVKNIKRYASDTDSYIRKNCYLILGRLYKSNEKIRESILSILDLLSRSNDEKVRQTTVYSLGEIGKIHFDVVAKRLELFLHDTHHSVKNGLTGAIKQMGEKNPKPVFAWVRTKIKKCDPDMQKRILHGLELRGRTHPEDLLPIIKEIVKESMDKKTRKMVTHIIGQISYKKGCLEKVTHELKSWKDKSIVAECEREILSVHTRYEKFSVLNLKEAEKYLEKNL